MTSVTIDLLDAFRSAAAEVSPNGKVPDVDLDAELEELALDSIQWAELVATMEEQTGIPARIEDFLDIRTVGDLVGVLSVRSRS